MRRRPIAVTNRSRLLAALLVTTIGVVAYARVHARADRENAGAALILPVPLVETLSPPPALVSRCANVSLLLTERPPVEGRFHASLLLRNGGDTPIDLMQAGERSTSGGRNPAVDFELTPSHIHQWMGCGWTNPFAEEDFLTLAAGEEKLLSEWAEPPTPSEKGTYTLRATYRNDPNAKPVWSRDPAEGVVLEARMRKTVPCEVTSNEITFVWTDEDVKARTAIEP